MKYMPGNVRIVKDNLFEPPIIFQLIQEASGTDGKEMYQVFNMGTRMEVYTDEKNADLMISIAKKFQVDAQVIGRVEASDKKELVIKTQQTEMLF
jgi:phosphoribosylformylglycinamidine cyclo-ligase